MIHAGAVTLVIRRQLNAFFLQFIPIRYVKKQNESNFLVTSKNFADFVNPELLQSFKQRVERSAAVQILTVTFLMRKYFLT